MAYVVGIAGGSGSGKTTLVRSLMAELGSDNAVLLEQDAYYRPQPGLSLEHRAARNYDHPDAIDRDLLAAQTRLLRAGDPVEAPIYDFARHERRDETRTVEPRPCILIEGILVLASAAVRETLDLAVFVDTHADLRLERRIRRDMEERGRDRDGILRQWAATVHPMHLEFVEPSKAHAHLIIQERDLAKAVPQLLERIREGLRSGSR